MRVSMVPAPPAPAGSLLDPASTLVFAHRGGTLFRPENTMAAFEHGLALGADGIELDVQLARDGVVVVCHDDSLDRTTNATGPVGVRTARELADVDAAWHYGADAGFPFRGRGLGIPRLREVLEAFPEAQLIVELKGSDASHAAAAVRDARETRALDRVCFGSFSLRLLAAARACGADVITSAGTEEIRRALYRSWLRLPPRRPAFQAFQVPERYAGTRVASRRFVETMVRARLPVHVWTVNDPDDMRRLLAWGVRGLITDRPDLAREIVIGRG
jgi:glycerophosphoryl diester phosphodiesterase